MKSILQVCAFGASNPGNFIASLLELQKKTKEYGYETIYAFPEKARDKEWCRHLMETNSVYFLPEARARILPKTYLIFSKIYKENQIEIMHSHFELYDIPATITAPKSVRIFWHLHDALKENYIKGNLSRKLLTKIQYGFMGKRAILLSVSKEHAYFAEILGFNKEKIYYFPNGINTERIIPIQKRPNSSDFLMFGWEIKRKGVDLAIGAMKNLDSNQVKIIIIGEEECKKYLEQNGVSGIVYKEPVKNVNELYGKIRGFLHISRAEGLSYALLEVIYAGVPVICSDIPENQFARKFHNVFFIKNEDCVEIAETIKFLNSEDLYLEENIRYNRKIIEEEYSVSIWCRNLLKLYLR